MVQNQPVIFLDKTVIYQVFYGHELELTYRQTLAATWIQHRAPVHLQQRAHDEETENRGVELSFLYSPVYINRHPEYHSVTWCVM